MITLSEAKTDAVFTFGRFNPPTTGHEKLIDALDVQRRKISGSTMLVYPSHSQNPKKDPLPHAKKVAYMKKMFPKYSKNITVDKSRTVFEVATSLHDKGFKSITMVVGSDRVEEFRRLLDKYNGFEGGRHGFYKFDKITVVSAGERDPDAEGVEGMSASKMRASAVANDYDLFKQGLPSVFKDGKKLFNDVRRFMNIKEEFNLTEEDMIRDLYIRGEIFNIGEDVLTTEGVQGKIVRKGTNYVVIEEEGNFHKTWLYDLIEMGPHEIIKNRIDQITHPKEYDALVKAYVKAVGDKKLGTKSNIAYDVIRQTSTKVNTKSFIDYINRLVRKGSLPTTFKAEYMGEIRGVKQDKDIEDKKGTQPAKYYSDLSKSTKSKRDTHFKKGTKMDDDNPDAYKPAPGDKKGKTKLSKYTQKYRQMYGNESVNERSLTDKELKRREDIAKDLSDDEFKKRYGKDWKSVKIATATNMAKNEEVELLDEKIEGLVKKSEKSGIPYSILKQVYNRGMAAWRTGHRPGTTPQQWAFARVNSFVTKSKGTWGGADKDLAAKARSAKSVKKESCCEGCDKEELYDHVIAEATYQGKEVQLNNPIRTSENPNKKFKVYTMGKNGKVIVVRFGDPNMSINRDDPKARASFRARHKCDQKKDKTTAGYWSCYQWRAGSKVDN